MSDFALEPHQLALKNALAPVLSRLRQALASRESASVPCAGMLLEVQWHIDRMPEEIQRLDDLVNGTLAPLVLDGGAPGELEEAVDDLGFWVDTWSARMIEVRRLHTDPEDRDARDWLVAVYRRPLVELSGGLETLVRVLEDPVVELERLGLPTEGPVELPLTIAVTTGPELVSLSDWARQRRRQLLPTERQTRRQGLGFWGWVGAIALGSWIGSSLADDD